MMTLGWTGAPTERGVVGFFRYHRGHPFASSALMEPFSKGFIRSIETFAAREGVPLLTFAPPPAEGRRDGRAPGKSHRYQVSLAGLRLALFFMPTYARLLRPGLARLMPEMPEDAGPLRAAFDPLEREVDACCAQAKLFA